MTFSKYLLIEYFFTFLITSLSFKGAGGEVDFHFFVVSYSFIEENGSYQELFVGMKKYS